MDYAQYSKKMVEQIIEEIPSEEVKFVVKVAFTKVAPAFWHVPASSTGKYHPLYACGDSGLARHTIAAVHFLKRAIDADLEGFEPYDISLMTAAMLLHDTCKLGTKFEERYTLFEHPILVYTLLSPADLNNNVNLWAVWTSINTLIMSHMGN